MNSKNTDLIPIFFASDDNYIPYLGVALRSLIDNANKSYTYNIHILNSGLKQENIDLIKTYETEEFKIEFVNVDERIESCKESLDTRDYYSKTIYYRIFIQSLYPQYDKVLYLDADIVVPGDISKLYNYDIGDNFVGAIQDQIVASVKEYRDYSRIVLGLDYHQYFNSGILVINLKKFREADIQSNFVKIINTYHFDTIAPDQDYLNFMLKGKVAYIPLSWNKESISDGYKGELNLIHYAFFKKPWTYFGMKYDKYFWEYAEKTVFYELLQKKRKTYTFEQKCNDKKGSLALKLKARKISRMENTFYNMLVKPYEKKEETKLNIDNIKEILSATNIIFENLAITKA